MRIKNKLIVGFSFILLLVLGTIAMSYTSIESLGSNIEDIAKDKLPKVVWSNDMIEVINDNARSLRNLILLIGSDDTGEIESNYKRFDYARQVVNDRLDSLRRTVFTDKGVALLDNIDKVRKEYFTAREILVALIKAGNKDEATKYILEDYRPYQRNYMDAVNDLIKYQTDIANTAADASITNVENEKSLLIILAIIIALALAGIGVYLTKSITAPLEKAVRAAEEIANGNTRVDLESKAKDETGVLLRAMRKMVESIELLIKDAGILSKAAVEGKLSTRADASCHQGDFRKIVEGVNDTLDAVIGPLNVAAEYVDRISKGDLPNKITDNYNGDFNEIKMNLNSCIETINLLLNNLTNLSSEIAQGEVSARIDDSKFSNSYKEIAIGINETVSILSSPLYEISDAIQATASASAQISSSAEEMAAGAQEQSAQAGEVASAVEEMTRTIIDTSRNTIVAADSSKESVTKAKEGGQIVKDVVNGMNKIANVVDQSASKIFALGQNSDKIGEIIQVIDDIADQTNLLALNAAIEAARAGEQGRGFAVVADEVRKLAERTTKATKEIAQMIKQIQADTNDAVESMKIGTENVIHGKELADKAGNILAEIIISAERGSDVVTQVAVAGEEQSATAEQISKSINSMNTVTQETATGIQQIARAAEDLNRLTINLQDLVQQFKLAGHHTSEAKRNSILKPKQKYLR